MNHRVVHLHDAVRSGPRAGSPRAMMLANA
jgi:hypothetical protein